MGRNISGPSTYHLPNRQSGRGTEGRRSLAIFRVILLASSRTRRFLGARARFSAVRLLPLPPPSSVMNQFVIEIISRLQLLLLGDSPRVRIGNAGLYIQFSISGIRKISNQTVACGYIHCVSRAFQTLFRNCYQPHVSPNLGVM